MVKRSINLYAGFGREKQARGARSIWQFETRRNPGFPMLENESLRQAIDESVRIVPYDPSWPQKFEMEKRRLLALFPGVFLGLEHIGSTAVPTLAAKRIIDVMGAVRTMPQADELVPRLCANGYATSAEFNATLVDRRWLMRHAEGHRTHHLHLVAFESKEWHRHLAFRDELRADSKIRSRYTELKSSLAASLGSDREAYTAAKSDFIAKILRDLA
jgi:GrpB-like predicted nucleotidyltransferase (UPF0157 family)